MMQEQDTQIESHHELVIDKVKAGDADAFTVIVADFQEIALASAYAWLGDLELARDAVQEAFLDAYLNLHQLKTPAAFPGWFRRIVLKHCDRQSRRKSFALVSIDEVGHVASSEASVLNTIISTERDQSLRKAVEKLPEAQRLIVALHYFGDVTGRQIADFLELPLSTVKKRLRMARKTVKQTELGSLPVMEKNTKTKMTQNFPDEVGLFIAIREKDHAGVEKLLAKSPELVDVEQDWDRDLVYEGILPFATRATALITTVELDDLLMLRILLEKGADPDGKCGCETGESPLWAAALLSRVAHVEALLLAGAEPNIVAASGNTPLHIAAMRGNIEIVKLLLAHGADPQAREQDGKTVWPLTVGATKTDGWRPLDWAQHNNHKEIAVLFNGSSEIPVEPVCTVIDQPLLETGIKAVDFFTPLQRGGLVRLPFKAGVGMLVLLGELNRVFLSHDNGAVVWTGFTQAPFDIAEMEAELCEFGLIDQVHMRLVSYKESAARQREGFERGIELIESLKNAGKEVLAIIQSTDGFEADIERAFYPLSSAQKGGAVTSIVLTPFRDAEQAWPALKAPYTSQITLDRARSIKHLYPGIDPALSMSKVVEADIGKLHLQLSKEVRDLLAWYRLEDPEFELLESSVSGTVKRTKATRARELIKYFTQPFKITEPFRGTTGLAVPRQQMLKEVQGIMAS